MSASWPHVIMFLGFLSIGAVLIDSLDGGGSSWSPVALGVGLVLYIVGRIAVYINRKK